MGAITSLEHRSIEVQPGGEATCSVLLRNDGSVVDQFTVEVLGDARAWAQVEPPMVNLLPNEESTVLVRFSPPRSSDIPAGVLPFGLRVASREDPAGSVVEEGTLTIGAFTDVRVELVPRRTRGRRQARCDVVVDNLGNSPVTLAVAPQDPDRNLRFRPEHTDLTMQPGTTAFVALTMRPERRFLRGPERTLPFQVGVTGAGVPPTTAEGAMVQEPLLPKWLPLAIAALLVALLALIALWFTVVRKSIQSSAREAANEQVQQVANTANKAKNRAEQAARAAGLPPEKEDSGAQSPGGGGGATPSTTPAPSATTPPPGPLAGEPIDFRIAPTPPGAPTTADPNDFAFFPYILPEGKRDRTILVSDLLLQNPFGDNGILRILRVVGNEPNANGDILLEVGLGNYRDLDYHFLQPWEFKRGERIVLAVNCQNPSVPENPQPMNNPCNPSASFSGQLVGAPPTPASSEAPPPPTTTTPAAPPQQPENTSPGG